MIWSLAIGPASGTPTGFQFIFLVLVAVADYLAGGTSAAVEPITLLGIVCITRHEFEHLVVTRRFRAGTREMAILPLGGTTATDRMPRRERQVAATGALATVARAPMVTEPFTFRAEAGRTSLTSARGEQLARSEGADMKQGQEAISTQDMQTPDFMAAMERSLRANYFGRSDPEFYASESYQANISQHSYERFGWAHDFIVPWLPRDVRVRYADRWPRRMFRDAMAASRAEGEEKAIERLARLGSGISFHEFELALGERVYDSIILTGHEHPMLTLHPISPLEQLVVSIFEHLKLEVSPAFTRLNMNFVLQKPVAG